MSTIKHRPETCKPIGEILSRVGDKWTIALLAALGDRRMRFKELHRAIDGISQRMLTVTVRNLERDGLLIRTVYPTIPPRVEYELSDLGRSLKDALAPVGVWVSDNHQDIEASRRQFDEKARGHDSGSHLSNGK
jgi:DNA-binding HxlR family transcriptional regulator